MENMESKTERTKARANGFFLVASSRHDTRSCSIRLRQGHVTKKKNKDDARCFAACPMRKYAGVRRNETRVRHAHVFDTCVKHFSRFARLLYIREPESEKSETTETDLHDMRVAHTAGDRRLN